MRAHAVSWREPNKYEYYVTRGSDLCLRVCEKHSITRGGVSRIVSVESTGTGTRLLIMPRYASVRWLMRIYIHAREKSQMEINTRFINSSRWERAKDGLTYAMREEKREKMLDFFLKDII